MAWGRWLAPTAVALAVLLAGCGREEGTSAEPATTSTTTTSAPTAVESIDGVPVLAGATQPPGTPLPDGFVTPPGATLLGEPLPRGVERSYRGEDVDDDGWRAVFLVTGDMEEAVAHLRTQCTRARRAHPDWRCELSWMRLRAAEDPFIEHATSALSIDLDKPSIATGGDPLFEEGTGSATAPLPDEWPELARPGDRFGWDDATEGPKALVLPADTYEVLPAFGALTTARHISYQAFLRVDGEPQAVVTAFEEQLQRLGADVDVERRDEDTGSVTRITAQFPAYYFIEVYDGGPGHRWVHLVTDPGD